MNVLLTGSSGFIGSHILSSLKKSYTFFAPSHKELDLLQEDMVRTYFKKNAIDIVIHCAVIGGNRKNQYVENMFYDNLRMFFNIVRCKDYFARLINIGSGAIYDKRYPIRKVKEEDLDKHVPDDEYGLYKYICAKYINHAENMVDLRIFGIFGEGEDYRLRFISNALCRYIHHMPIVMNQNVYFDYLYIGDFITFVKHFIMRNPAYSAYNIGSGTKVSLLHIAKYINTLDTYQVKIIVKKPGLNNEYTGNTGRLFNELSGLEPTPLRESIKSLFHQYKDNIHSIKRTEI